RPVEAKIEEINTRILNIAGLILSSRHGNFEPICTGTDAQRRRAILILSKRRRSDNNIRLYCEWKRSNVDVHNGTMDFLRGFMRKRFKKALLRGSDFTNFARFLEGAQIDHSDIFFDVLSNEAVINLDNLIRNREIPMLTVAMSDLRLTDPVRFMLYLSQKFGSIHIDQSCIHKEGNLFCSLTNNPSVYYSSHKLNM
ncbi:hypothetical protein PMAYCL1PPCAC_21418, partial [Pristionchus mayeri]